MITYFKVVYRRHTNFAMESIEQTFDGTVDFGRRVTALVSRNGDLVMGAYIQALLPDLRDKNVSNETAFSNVINATTGAAHRRYTRWVDNVGHYLLRYIDIEIGGQLIDRHYGDWLEIWAQLTISASKMIGYRKMIGQDPRSVLGQNTGLQADVFSRTTAVAAGASNPKLPVTETVIKGRHVFVPLQFWFCRNEGLALPLVALQYHEVRIVAEFRQSYELVQVNLGDRRNGTWATTSQYAECIDTLPLVASLWVDYVYLDTDERRRFSQVSHEYLIEQLQFLGDETVSYAQDAQSSVYKSFSLNFSHPVKELVWVLKGFEEEKEWCNFTDTGLSVVPPVQTQTVTTGSTAMGLTGLPALDSYVIPSSQSLLAAKGLDTISSLSRLAQFANYDATRPMGRGAQGTGLAQNPVRSAKILLNGHDRIAERPGSYFNWVQTYKHHSNIPASPGINVYSFALDPEAHDPSSTCNFSRIDKAKLLLHVGTTWRDGSYGIKETGILKIFAVNYNVLRIMSGMGGLAYRI